MSRRSSKIWVARVICLPVFAIIYPIALFGEWVEGVFTKEKTDVA